VRPGPLRRLLQCSQYRVDVALDCQHQQDLPRLRNTVEQCLQVENQIAFSKFSDLVIHHLVGEAADICGPKLMDVAIGHGFDCRVVVAVRAAVPRRAQGAVHGLCHGELDRCGNRVPGARARRVHDRTLHH
jgi:hypothetical protein